MIGSFEKWATQINDRSYTFDNILQYFQKSYTFHPPDNSRWPANASATFNSSDWSPTGEPVQVTFSAWVNPVPAWLGLSFQELGFQKLQSLLSGTLIGWSWMSVTLHPMSQTRSSSEAFLRASMLQSSNLVLYKNTMAKKILFENGTAVGVAVNSGGNDYNISASHEVIVSAGVVSLDSPFMSSNYLLQQQTSQMNETDSFTTNTYGFRHWFKRDSSESRHRSNIRASRSRPKLMGELKTFRYQVQYTHLLITLQ